MKPTYWRVAIHEPIRGQTASLLLALTFMFTGTSAFADGCFVFRWNKQKDINEPTQKAIILHDQNREDLILQVKYEGPAEDFGWLIPVPAQPEVRKGSMDPFYELSRLTQRQFHEGQHNDVTLGLSRAGGEPEVKVIEIKTVGAYEVAILSSTNPSALADWLAAHQFGFPKEKQNVLDQYIQRHWFFVAARINPEGNGFVVKTAVAKPDKIGAGTRKKLANGELHPIIISFASEKCVFPLAISSVNGSPSEISLYVLSSEPLLNRVIYDRKLKVYKDEKEKWIASRGERDSRRRNFQDSRRGIILDSPMGTRMRGEDPNDPPPDSVFERPDGSREREPFEQSDEDFYSDRLQLVRSMSVRGDDEGLKGCQHDLPRFRAKSWWLTKLVETFQPQEMVDLEFEPAIPFLADKLSVESGEAAAHCLPQYGGLAVPGVVKALNHADTAVRKRGLIAAMEMSDPRFVDPVLKLMQDEDASVRRNGCYAAAGSWDPKFVEPLIGLTEDPNPAVAAGAGYCIRSHRSDINLDAARLRQMLAKDGLLSLFALEVLQTRHEISHGELVHLLSYTNLPTLSSAFTPIRYQLTVDEVSPLVTNSLPIARLMALGVLVRIADRPAVERIVSMLRDPNEAVRWRVRSALRRLTGQKLGAEAAAYEKWWAENKEIYVPRPQELRPGRS